MAKSSKKPAQHNATDEQYPAHSTADDLDQDEETDQEQDDDEEEEEESRPRSRGGRPRSSAVRSTWSMTAVFKSETEYQEFVDEAENHDLSPSAYLIKVVRNRHNTVEGQKDYRAEALRLRSRVERLEGAKEELQGLYEVAMGRTQTGGLSGLEQQQEKPVGPAALKKLIDEAVVQRENETKLARLPIVEKELEQLQKDYEELEAEMERTSSFESKAQIYGAPLVQGLAGTFPELAQRIISSPLGALAGLTPGDTPALGPATNAAVSNDPLVLAAQRTRENIAPNWCPR